MKRKCCSSRVLITITCAVLASVMILEASAEDFFVNNIAGDDRRTGTAEKPQGSNGPFRSIARALRAARKGDRIILSNTGEPYRECLSVQAGNHSGSVIQPFTIIGNGATLDGSAPVPGDQWQHVAGDVFRFRPPRTAYQQLFLNDKPVPRKRASKDASAFPKLAPVEWCLFDRHIYFRVEPGQTPDLYNLTYAAHPVGITLYETRFVLIRDLVVQGYQLDGINAHDSVFGAGLVNVMSRGNGRSGVSVGGASRVKMTDCVAGDNGVAQVRTEGHCLLELSTTELIDDGVVPPLQKEGGRVSVVKPFVAPPRQ